MKALSPNLTLNVTSTVLLLLFLQLSPAQEQIPQSNHWKKPSAEILNIFDYTFGRDIF